MPPLYHYHFTLEGGANNCVCLYIEVPHSRLQIFSFFKTGLEIIDAIVEDQFVLPLDLKMVNICLHIERKSDLYSYSTNYSSF